jgi:hypothetical protein
MALPANVLAGGGSTAKQTGIQIALFPGSTDFNVEIQRAPDNGSGQPNVGAAETIIILPPIVIEGQSFTDLLPLDGAKRFYRSRHVKANWTDGDWTAWTPGVAPVVLGDYEFYFNPLPIINDKTLVGDSRSVLQQVEPSLIPNAEFDVWERF